MRSSGRKTCRDATARHNLDLAVGTPRPSASTSLPERRLRSNLVLGAAGREEEVAPVSHAVVLRRPGSRQEATERPPATPSSSIRPIASGAGGSRATTSHREVGRSSWDEGLLLESV